MKKGKLRLIIVGACLCLTGCGDSKSSTTANNSVKVSDTITNSFEESTIENTEDVSDPYENTTWLESFDWGSVSKFDVPENFSISNIAYPLNFDTLLSNNFCVLNISGDDSVEVGGKSYYTISDFKDIVGKENFYVPTYYLGKYFDRDEERETVDASASCYAKGGELKTVQSIGTLVYTNEDDSLVFNDNSRYCISIQYPMSQPTIILPTGLNYTQDEEGYYEYMYEDWMNSLVKNNLGKPTKIYGMYTDIKEPVTWEDGSTKVSNNYITWGDYAGYECLYKLVWEYNSSCIVLEVKEVYDRDRDASVTKYVHGFSCYSLELYSSKEAFDTMATYLDKNCIDITNDMLK